MENKKNYVDGIDVSECVCFATAQGVATVNGILVKDIDNACTVKQKPCEDIKNCMFKKQYKQLQRLKSENENLKIYIESNKQQIEEVETLVMENAELKSDIESRTMCITCERELQNCNLQAENERLKEKHKKLSCKILEVSALNKTLVQECKEEDCEQLKKYRQALQEIQEDLETQSYCECSECGNDEYDKCIECMTKRYLTKINEVIGEE